MRRMICTMLLLGTLVNVAWAQFPGDGPGNKNEQAPTGPGNALRAELQPGAAESGLDSELGIGARAPDFNMDGSQGQAVHLSDLKGHWALIVFSETRNTMAPLEGLDGDLRKVGVSLYGICRDAAPTLKTYAAHQQLSFVLLSDMTREVSQVYGMYDEDNQQIQPGIVLLDPKGVVRMTLLGQSLHAAEILQLVLHSVTGA